MNLELTEEQVDLRDTVRRYLTEKAGVSGHVRAMLNDPTGTTAEVWRGLVGLGTTSLVIPLDCGGAGASMIEAGVVSEELGAALHPGPWLSSAVAAPRALMRFGADNRSARQLFSGIADGSIVACVAIPAQRSALAVTNRHGDDVIVDGELDQVPDAAAADILLTVTGSGQQDLCAIPLASPAVRIDETEGIDKSRKMFRVTLDGAAAQIVAMARDDNAEAAEALIDDMIVAWGADALGAARQVLQMTVDYAKVRRQFGAPIGSFQAVAHLCVDMHETVELARSGVQYALWAADSADRAERHRAALRVKAFAGRLATVGDLAIQIFGGIGFTAEHDAQLYLKRLLSFSRFRGSPGPYLEQVGRELATRTT